MQKKGYVYIVGSQKPVLYTGVTSELEGRTWKHKHSVYKGFTSKYHTFKLLYYKEFDSIEEAIYREKQIKHWKRAWKLELIRSKKSIV